MARKLTEDFIGTCQWCLGEYKVNARKTVVLHGYRRPGHGYAVGNCDGVGYAPFEYKNDHTKLRIKMMNEDVAKLDKQIAMIDAGKVAKVPNPYFVPEKDRSDRWYRHQPEHDITHLVPGDKYFDRTLQILRTNLDNERRFNNQIIAYFEQAVSNWKLGQIVGLDVPATGKERYVRDAYDPEKVKAAEEFNAAKAARDAKPGKITINVYGPVPFPSQDAGHDEDSWRAAIEQHYEAEKAFKEKVKAWGKATFPGKVWVGDGDDQEIRVITGRSAWSGTSGEKIIVVAIKPEWQHLDQVMAMFPTAHRYDKDTNRRDKLTNHGIGKGKDIRLWVSVDDLPK